MTFTYLILFKIICLNTFLEFLSFVYVTSKLNILSNHIKYPKRLIPYYMLSFFIILQFPYPIDELVYLKKDDFNSKKRLSRMKKSSFQDPYWPFNS